MHSEFQTVFFSHVHTLEVREWSRSKSTNENEPCSRSQEDDLDGLRNFMESISKKD
jgi:hypothetical protein